MKLWNLFPSSVRASLCHHQPGWGRGVGVGGDVPRLHPSRWRVKTSWFWKGVNAPAPHPTLAETSLWGGGAGPGYCWVGVRVQAPMWSLLTLLRGLLAEKHRYSPPHRLYHHPFVEGGWDTGSPLGLCDGGRVGASALPVVLLSSHIIIDWKFAVLLGCLVPDLLLESTGLSSSFSMSIDASGYLLPQPLIQDIRSAKKTQGKHHHVLPWPPESAASLPFSCLSESPHVCFLTDLQGS